MQEASPVAGSFCYLSNSYKHPGKHCHENIVLIVKWPLNYLKIDTFEKIKCHQVTGSNDTIHSHSLAYMKNSSGTQVVFLLRERDAKIVIQSDNKNIVLFNNS